MSELGGKDYSGKRLSPQAADAVIAELKKYLMELADRWLQQSHRVLGGLAEHEIHHRSQLCEYLSGAGIEPPALYGLHAEELPR